MQTGGVEKGNRQGCFDRFSRAMQGKLIQPEVGSLEPGARIEADPPSRNGSSHDKKGNAPFIGTDEIEQVLRSPLQMFVAVGAQDVNSLEVRQMHGPEQIINFSEPPTQPAAG